MRRMHQPAGAYGVMVLVLSLIACGTRAQLPDEAAVREGVERRLKALQSVVVEYDVEESFFPKGFAVRKGEAPPPPQPVGGGIWIGAPKTGVERGAERFSFLEGRARWDQVVDKETVAALGLSHDPLVENTQSYVEGVWSQLVIRRKGGPAGATNDFGFGRFPGAMQFALGLRDGLDTDAGKEGDFKRAGWMTVERLRGMAVWRDDEGNVVLERLNRVGQPLRWVLDAKRGYAVLRYQRLDHQSAKVIEEVAGEEYALVQGIELPMKVVWRYIHTDGHLSREWVAKVKRYALNDPANDPDAYHLGWRKGMYVWDVVRAKLVQITEDGQKLRP